MILKPLDGMGGSSIFRVRRDDVNRNVIIETMAHFGARSVMAQRFIPEIAEGDKRIIADRRRAGAARAGAHPEGRARRAATSRRAAAA